MGISNIFKKALPVAIGVATGNPFQAFAGFAAADQAEKQQKKAIRENEKQVKLFTERFNQMADPLLGNIPIGSNTQIIRPTTASAGFGSSFGSFLSDVGQNILGPLGNIFASPIVRPFISQQSSQQPAVPTLSTSGGLESAESGSQTAFVGGLGPIAGAASRFLRTPTGGAVTGLIGGLGANLLGGSQQKVRITRKMKAQYRSILNLNMGNYEMAADMVGVPVDFFISVLLKRFRNDGPVVTKAALRKTKTTVRRLKSMCDMYDSLRPTATRRRAPMRRASSTTLIKN